MWQHITVSSAIISLVYTHIQEEGTMILHQILYSSSMSDPYKSLKYYEWILSIKKMLDMHKVHTLNHRQGKNTVYVCASLALIRSPLSHGIFFSRQLPRIQLTIFCLCCVSSLVAILELGGSFAKKHSTNDMNLLDYFSYLWWTPSFCTVWRTFVVLVPLVRTYKVWGI